MYYNPVKKHYYNIDVVLNYFKNNETALEYLTNIIDRSDPDNFHWTDVENANKLIKG